MPKVLKLGILSDSHTKTTLHQEAIDHLLASGAEYLLHAGDIMLEEHLKMLEASAVPYTCVYGNNDTALIPLYNQYNIKREPYYFKIEELRIKMMHLPYFMSADADIVISGHTHIFESSMNGKTLYINPGEVCAREKPLTECAMIEVIDGKYSVTHYFREPAVKVWKARKVDL
ncbi:YfcE family phosphodiesterase [bacterium]|nr:YfcE family phosphodiesterase [bacterium]MBU1957827.1 YfcE family phosphodiesterase [bacterium]